MNIVQVGWCGGEVELGHDNHLPSTQVRSCSCLAVAGVASSGGRPSFCFISPDQWERRVGAGGRAGPIRGQAAVSGYDIWRNYRLVITHSARPAPEHCLIRDQAPVTTQSAATLAALCACIQHQTPDHRYKASSRVYSIHTGCLYKLSRRNLM